VADAPLEVVHTYESRPGGVRHRVAVIDDAARRDHDEARRRARHDVEAFLESRAFPATAIVVREGLPQRAILEVAAHHDSDLVIVGSHGRTGLAHRRLGSVSEAVVREAPCDVLVVRPPRSAPFAL
jgi:universal stress protein A